MKEEEIQKRKEKGYIIAKTSRIEKTDKGWKVPSQSGSGFYTFTSNGFGGECNCPDFETRHCKCKHLWGVELFVTKQVDNDGNITITQTVKKTYKQDWKNYDLAQTNEKRLFIKYLGDITNNLEQPEYMRVGRPNKILGDTVFSMVYKVYSTFSSRRFNTDMQTAKEQGIIEQITPRSSMSDYFNNSEITPILCDMVTLTSLPLRSVERDFAVDSTGFGTSNFQRWFSFKHGRELCSRKWVKCHFCCGVKSNIITSVKVTSEFSADSPEFEQLVKTTSENFDMDEVSADKAYLSRDNLNVVESLGAVPYVPYKSNSKPNKKGSQIWKKMYHYFMLNNDEWAEHYHKRSNAESVVHMVKSKFGDSVRSKSWTAQVNEVLCKVICHNLACCISETYNLGIEADFVRKLPNVSENYA